MLSVQPKTGLQHIHNWVGKEGSQRRPTKRPWILRGSAPYFIRRICSNKVHPTLSGGSARTKLSYVDDFNLKGKISNVAQDVQIIISTQVKTGLVLNMHKCEMISNNFDQIDQYPVFNQFKKVQKEDMTFMSPPVLPGMATDKVLQDKIDDLGWAIKQFALLQAHDELCLLNNSIGMPKL